MRYIEPHGHMVSRTTDDYQDMVTAGCAAVCEPAFWAGFDRSSVDGFHDYFCQLTDYEPKRAAKFGLPHFAWLCINPKESEDVALATDVIGIIPKFLDRPNVLGIGEIGLNKNSRNEMKVLEMHVDLAARNDQLILVHTPHLEDKLKGTRLILDVLRSDKRIRPERCIIDHVEEHTIQLVLDAGFWAGMTLYPESKCSPARAVDMLDLYSHERIWMNSACDWGVSIPLAVPRTALEMKRRGWPTELIDKVIYRNPIQFLSQCPKFKLP
ncbi:MAG: metal-dependent hydrolase [Verrucomicrobia bacterium]|nr:metal-dependent hydrolase [Verrucomicrobiota bacterium]NBU10402.1 metal-dependent hydrolase [Pseudomonadota bacterium]NDA68928.1 metal-dependent hydrolase [Verrucomicrobiota bacterium]NDB76939.1 metal-dependent hydrolase [Verrucomicrobiota bacterium]NDD40620.1 metal-dependent hydrolase [Verrucomicrobiota bacterium]